MYKFGLDTFCFILTVITLLLCSLSLGQVNAHLKPISERQSHVAEAILRRSQERQKIRVALSAGDRIVSKNNCTVPKARKNGFEGRKC